MESGMTMSDYMTLEKVGNRQRGVANTALGLGIAGLAVGLVGTFAVGWGLNTASKARSRAAENLAAAYATRQNDLLSLIATERNSRETWQTANQPSISQTLELQNNPSLQSTVQDIVTAMAAASATATANANNNGLASAVGGDHFLRVQRYSAPQPCGCDSCNG